MEKEAIVCIVNPGYAELAMNAARECGASGGTILNAKGSGRRDIEKILDIPVSQERLVVLIVVDLSIRDAVLNNINNCVGFNTAGHGIAFSLPIKASLGFQNNAPKTKI